MLKRTCGPVVLASLTVLSSIAAAAEREDAATASKRDFYRRVFRSNLSFPIPDNSASGYTVPLIVPETYPAGKIVVGARIEHPDRGELVVTLLTPGGAPAGVLHNKTGSGTANLVLSGSEITNFSNVGTKGTWKLWVQDVKAGKSGKVLDWSIAFRLPDAFDGTQKCFTSAVSAFSVPAYGSVSKPIPVSAAATLGVMTASASTTASFGTVALTLRAPTGREFEVVGNTLSPYSVETPFIDFAGQPAEGLWSLTATNAGTSASTVKFSMKYGGQDCGKTVLYCSPSGVVGPSCASGTHCGKDGRCVSDEWTCADADYDQRWLSNSYNSTSIPAACDCNCGTLDPDCLSPSSPPASDANDPQGCPTTEAMTCTTHSGQCNQTGWYCGYKEYNTFEKYIKTGKDSEVATWSCDCACGKWDPDCDIPTPAGLCMDDKPLVGAVCDKASNSPIPTAWTCAPSRYGDAKYDTATKTWKGTCDCNCGIEDPDCAVLSCSATSLNASPFCNVKTGLCEAVTWTGASAKFKNGTCDCNQGDADPDCDTATSTSANGCSHREWCSKSTGACSPPVINTLYVHGRTSVPVPVTVPVGFTAVGATLAAATPSGFDYWRTSGSNPFNASLHGLSPANNVAVNWSGVRRIHNENAKIVDAFNASCTGSNLCYVYCHSAGCLQTEYALAHHKAAIVGPTYKTWNIIKVFATSSAEGGSALGDFSYNEIDGGEFNYLQNDPNATYVEECLIDSAGGAIASAASGKLDPLTFLLLGCSLSHNTDAWQHVYPLDMDLRQNAARSMFDHNDTGGVRVSHAAGHRELLDNFIGDGLLNTILTSPHDGAVSYSSACGCNQTSQVSSCANSDCTHWTNHISEFEPAGYNLNHSEMKRGTSDPDGDGPADFDDPRAPYARFREQALYNTWGQSKYMSERPNATFSSSNDDAVLTLPIKPLGSSTAVPTVCGMPKLGGVWK